MKMATPPQMRDLARQLLAYEAVAGRTSEPAASATFHVYEKLRQSLIALSGVASFYSLASRALILARSEAPTLHAAWITTDGSIHGLAEFEPGDDMDRVQGGDVPAGEEGTILIARLLSLLHLFIGEALTFSLLRAAWPGTDIDGLNSGNGRTS